MRAAAWTFAICAAAAPALAQSPGPVIGSPAAGHPAPEPANTSYQWGTKVAAAFVPVAGVVEPPEVKGLPPSTLDGIDAARFGFASVRAYFERRQAPEDERSQLTSSATLRLWLALTQPDGGVRWWRLEPTGRAGDAAEVLSITDTPEAPHIDAPTRHAQDSIAFLSPAGGAEPVIMARYGARMFGANSGAHTSHHLLIDLRSAQPRIIGIFDEASHSCGGVCSHYMCIYFAGEHVGCRWDSTANDLVCASTMYRTDTGWGLRQGTRRFRFSDGAALPAAIPPPPPDLDPTVLDAAVTTRIGEGALVDAVGHLTVIGDVPLGQGTVRLMGAPSLSDRFDARLFVTPVERGRRGRIYEIQTRTTSLDGQRRLPDTGSPAGVFTPSGAPPRFAASLAGRTDTETLVRVVVAEGMGRAVYLVGLTRAPALPSEAILVATDAQSYADCGQFTIEATAVSMRMDGPLRAVLDVEGQGRSHELSDTPSDPQEEPCAGVVTLTWGNGAFDVTADPMQCSRRPRRWVRIDEAGALRTASSPDPRRSR